MKKLALFLCMSVVLMMACQKEEPTPNEVDETHTAPAQNYPSTAEVIYDAVTDIDGNHYDAVKIGNQIWMASNLRTTRYADGEAIPDINESHDTDKPYRDVINTNIKTYGYLYNWPAVMHKASSSNANPSGVQGICPNGWHVPSQAEWVELILYCSDQSEYVCNIHNGSASGIGENIAKVLADDNGWEWISGECVVGNNFEANNVTGFSALPAGNKYLDSYIGEDRIAYFWSATVDCPKQSVCFEIWNSFPKVADACIDKVTASSIRCVKN